MTDLRARHRGWRPHSPEPDEERPSSHGQIVYDPEPDDEPRVPPRRPRSPDEEGLPRQTCPMVQEAHRRVVDSWRHLDAQSTQRYCGVVEVRVPAVGA